MKNRFTWRTHRPYDHVWRLTWCQGKATRSNCTSLSLVLTCSFHRNTRPATWLFNSAPILWTFFFVGNLLLSVMCCHRLCFLPRCFFFSLSSLAHPHTAHPFWVLTLLPQAVVRNREIAPHTDLANTACNLSSRMQTMSKKIFWSIIIERHVHICVWQESLIRIVGTWKSE